MRFLLAVCLAALISVVLPGLAWAQFEVSAYGGANTASSSDVELDQDGFSESFDVDWYGDSFEMPPYYGLRGTYWLGRFSRPNWGVAIDFTHSKVKADLDDDEVGDEFDRLEFTDGLNTGTLNLFYRMPLTDRFGAYAGVGAGISVPHVEVTTTTIEQETFEYQLAGPAAQGLVGGSMKLGYGFSAFTEYKANYSWNDTDLEDGGSLEADVLTHQIAVGISFDLDRLGF